MSLETGAVLAGLTLSILGVVGALFGGFTDVADLWHRCLKRSRQGVPKRTLMDWARILAYVTGTVDQQLLVRNEYLAAENRIIKAQLKGRLKLSIPRTSSGLA